MIKFYAFISTAAALSAPAKTPDAAVVVPGFLEGATEFVGVAKALRKRGIPATVAPIHRWHWIPCLGGRSVRPILARIDHACAYATTAEKLDVVAPFSTYTAADLVSDFVNNPGGVLKAGGSADPDEFPYVEPRGSFGAFNGRERRRGCSIVGHSAAGWISRIYLSEERYGGHSHRGLARGVRRLVTLGSPHAASDGVAFANVAWARREPAPVEALAVAGAGFRGDEAGSFTRDSYEFCGLSKDEASVADGDGVTPLSSALDFAGAERLTLAGTTIHAANLPSFLSPELAESDAAWYGDEARIDEWARFLVD